MSKFIPPPNSNTGMTRVECFYNYSNSVNNPSIANVESIRPDNSKLDDRDKDKKLSQVGENLIKPKGQPFPSFIPNPNIKK